MKRREFLATAGGATGGVAAASAGAAEAQEDGGGGGGGTTHTVNMEGLKFAPETITVAPGDTVVWDNVSTAGHSVTAYEDEIPDEAAYFASGGFESESAARSGWPDGEIPPGESYEHTFEVEGSYGYFCIPHEGAGMVGTVEVKQGANQGGGGGGSAGPTSPEHFGVPFQPHFVGIATILGIVLTITFTFYVLKYGESPHASSPNRK